MKLRAKYLIELWERGEGRIGRAASFSGCAAVRKVMLSVVYGLVYVLRGAAIAEKTEGAPFINMRGGGGKGAPKGLAPTLLIGTCPE